MIGHDEYPEKYDVIDEVTLAVAPKVAYRAVVDEISGKTNWWMPHRSAELREGESYDQIGAICDTTIHGKWPIKYTTRTVDAVENETIEVRYVGGALRGEGYWRFDQEGDKTRLSYRWRTTPAGALRVLSPVLPVAKSHSHVMRDGFDALNDFLEAPPLADLRSRRLARPGPARRPSSAVALVLVSAIGGAVYLLAPLVRKRGRFNR